MRFGSVCSGIEAASVAWEPLGWQAAWFAEIEPFPSAVLTYHYANVKNLGDMTALPELIRAGEVEAPEVFCGGTPCQAFSVAGLRQSLGDARGNLSLTFCEIANAIDDVRSVRGDPPVIVFWENVPGVLSTADNAFGCFLAGLAGEEEPLKPAGGRWTNAGAVLGPKRSIAWRTLDAQYFGLAQRRKRVFVVASARDGFDPAAVLFEFAGVRRDTAPSREAGKGLAPTIAGCANGGGANGPSRDVDSVESLQFGPVISPALKARDYKGPSSDGDGDGAPLIAHSLRGEGFDASEDGTGRGTPLVPVSQPYTLAIRGRGDSHNLEYRQDGTANALLTPNGGRGGIGVGAIAHAFDARQSDVIQYGDKTGLLDTDGHSVGVVAFDTTQITSATNRSNPQPGDPCHPLAAGAHAPAIAFHPTQDPISSTDGTTHAMGCGSSGGQASVAVAFSSKDYGADATTELAPTLRAMNHAESHANGGGQMAVAFRDTADCLTSAYGTKWNGNASADNGSLYARHAMQVRRLTPVECERLQGFPDSYTAIPWRNKPASECPDGPRYKALGNSWAVPVVRWIGQRIHNAVQGKVS